MNEQKYEIALSLKDEAAFQGGLRRITDDGVAALKRLEGGAGSASKALARLGAARGDAGGGMQGLATASSAVAAALSAFGPAGRLAGAGAAVAGLAFSQAVAAARNAVAAFDEVAETADRIGVATDALQELRFAADLSGVGAEGMDKALEKLSRKVGEAAAGVDEAEKTFKRLGVSVLDAGGDIKTADKLLEELAGRFAAMESPAERAATAAKLFGDEVGGKMAAMLAGGGDAMAKLRNEARELGVVIDEHVLRQAGQTADELDKLARVINVNVSAALVDLAPVFVDLARGFAAVTGDVRALIDSFKELDQRSSGSLKRRLGEIGAQRETLTAAHAAKAGGLEGDLADMRAHPEAFTAEIAARKQVLDGVNADFRRQLADLDAERARIEAILQGMADNATKPTPARAELPRIEKSDGKKSSDEEADRQGEYIQGLRDKIVVLSEEETVRHRLEAVMKAQEIAMKDGNLLTVEQRDEIVALADSVKAYEKAIADAKEEKQQLARVGQQVGSTLARGFEDAILQANNLRDALGGVLNSLARIALAAAAAPAEKALSSWFGGLFGGGASVAAPVSIGAPILTGTGFYHAGGIAGLNPTFTRPMEAAAFVGAPRYHGGGRVAGLMDGEIPAVLRRGEGVFTPQQMAALAPAGAGTTVNYHQTVNVTVNRSGGGDAAGDKALAGEVARQVQVSLRAMVTQEIIQQQRPGGVLSGGF